MLFSAITVILALVLLNELVRWTWYRNFVPNRFKTLDWQLITALRPGFKGEVPVGVARPRVWASKNARFRLSINSQGMRALGPVKPKAEGLMRIICLGDSYTFGTDVDDEYTYPGQLQDLLNQARAARFEVINAGVMGYSSRQGLVYLREKLLNLEPDLVILEFGLNDAQPAVWTTFRSDAKMIPGDASSGFKKIYASPANFGLLLLVKQPLVVYLRYLTARMKQGQLFGKGEKPALKPVLMPMGGKRTNLQTRFRNARVPPDDFLANLDAFVRLGRERGFKLVFYIPYKILPDYKNLIWQAASRNQIPVADFSDRFDAYDFDELLKNKSYAEILDRYRKILGDDFLRRNPSLLLTTDGLHPNAVANRLIAEEFAQIIGSSEPPKTPAP